MTDDPGNGPIIDFEAQPTQKEKTAILSQPRKATQPPSPPPIEALNSLYEAACGDTGGSQAARNFLFWLASELDPTGYQGNGGLELRRLDSEHKAAALNVLTWWVGPTQSDQPLYQILRKLTARHESIRSD